MSDEWSSLILEQVLVYLSPVDNQWNKNKERNFSKNWLETAGHWIGWGEKEKPNHNHILSSGFLKDKHFTNI